VAEKIMSLKFDVGYIELRSQPVQVRTQWLMRSLTYAAVVGRISTYAGSR
jgi:hypothetical protein